MNKTTLLVIPLVLSSLLAACAPAAMPAADAMPKQEVTESETMAKTDTMTETETIAKSDAMTETETMAKSDVMTETEAMAKSDVMTETEAMAKSDVMTETEAIAKEEPTAAAMMTAMTGNFSGRDASHQGSGTATLIEENGQYLLKLSNFSVSDGPDLFVILVENPNTFETNALGAQINLGALQSTSGEQTYAIPVDADLSNIHGVIIHCVSFSFVFATAPFQAP